MFRLLSVLEDSPWVKIVNYELMLLLVRSRRFNTTKSAPILGGNAALASDIQYYPLFPDLFRLPQMQGPPKS